MGCSGDFFGGDHRGDRGGADLATFYGDQLSPADPHPLCHCWGRRFSFGARGCEDRGLGHEPTPSCFGGFCHRDGRFSRGNALDYSCDLESNGKADS